MNPRGTHSRGLHALVAGALVLVTWSMPGCRDIPAPPGGVQALGPVLLPSPGVVAGDTMRDSAGVVAPLALTAFAVNGDTIRNVPATFVALDTGAHLAGALLLGDRAGLSVRVVGSAEGLQTQPATVKVTLSPDTLVGIDSGVYRVRYSLIAGDTIATSPDLVAKAMHREGAASSNVEAVVVRYTIERAPAAAGGRGPSLVLLGGSGASSRDTTDAGGAARRARLRLLALQTFASDTAVVSATASYRGRNLGTVTFTVIFTNGGQ